MDPLLDQISLCTFSTGGSMVREVLDDWLHFLGGRPKRVIFAVSPEDHPPPIYEELRAEGRIDQIIPIASRGRSAEETNAEAVHAAVSAASTEWVLVLKLDTLPYRSGQESWLAESLRLVQDHGLFGLTGSFRLGDHPSLIPGYCTTQKYSENFGIVRKVDWLRAVHAFVGDDGYASERVRSTRFRDEEHRYINEFSIETFMENNNLRMLIREESRDWSIFHVNVWGETLRKVRSAYLSRRGVDRFLNNRPLVRREYHYPWELYYGTPPPPPLKRVRIAIGHWRRGIMARIR